MNISHVSCSEILIISLSVTGSIGLVTYYSDTNAVGRQAYEEQKQVLIDRAEDFVDAKDTLLLSIADHLNSPGFKEQSIKILSSKKRFRPNRSNVISTSDGDLVTSRLFQTDLEAESMSILTAGAIIALSTETNKIAVPPCPSSIRLERSLSQISMIQNVASWITNVTIPHMTISYTLTLLAIQNARGIARPKMAPASETAAAVLPSLINFLSS